MNNLSPNPFDEETSLSLSLSFLSISKAEKDSLVLTVSLTLILKKCTARGLLHHSRPRLLWRGQLRVYHLEDRLRLYVQYLPYTRPLQTALHRLLTVAPHLGSP